MVLKQKNNVTNQTILNEDTIINNQIVEEIADLLNQDNPTDIDCISLYDVKDLISKTGDTFNKIFKSYKKHFIHVLQKKYFKPKVSICYINNPEKKLFFTIDSQHICFIKQDDDLRIENPNTYSDEIMSLLGNTISELFDIILQYSGYLNESKHNIESINTNFLIDRIDQTGIIISNSENLKLFHNDDFLYQSTTYATRERENELLKKIFISIDECPEWTKESLYQIRQDQLTKENKKIKKLELKNILKK